MSTTTTKYPYKQPEIWAGFECTISRTGDEFRDQLEESGHYNRLSDIEKIGRAGVKKLRYPILWEKHEGEEGTEINWTDTRLRLDAIRENGMEPIAGLLHHGSGPKFTNLLDDEFALKAARYAAKVAEQFPWIKYYTPVNEPLTTARFSGLYGFWYPHLRDEYSFFKALLNQVKATILCMNAVREVNPDAQLVQTEDLAKVHSSKELQYQARYENERRWLSIDLLCGLVNRQHVFWKHLIKAGITEEELNFFIDNACPPDILGFNYYVTSERYLDVNYELYHESLQGGNGRHRYADTEAVRMHRSEGPATLLREAYQRYGIPMAITECHLSCTREEQLRWFMETWETCNELVDEGIDIKAITAWALLGSFDWDSLLVNKNQNYETGVFDIRGDKVRPTALFHMIKSLAHNGTFDHPLLCEKGWWNWKYRGQSPKPIKMERPLLIIGKNGTLGQAFIRTCERRSIPAIAVTRQQLDITKVDSIQEAIRKYNPWAIINAAGYVKVDDAEMYRDECFDINATAPGLLAKACNQHGIKLMTFSSDLVFDGIKKQPYHELDTVHPLNVYGASKAEGERRTLSSFSDALVIRTSAFFGPWDRYNFVYKVIESLKGGQKMQVANDVIVSPTYVPDLANTSLDLFIDDESGIWHLSNEGMMSWADFSYAVADRAGIEKKNIECLPLDQLGWKASRPLYSVLNSEKGVKLPKVDDALVRYFEHQVF